MGKQRKKNYPAENTTEEMEEYTQETEEEDEEEEEQDPNERRAVRRRRRIRNQIIAYLVIVVVLVGVTVSGVIAGRKVALLIQDIKQEEALEAEIEEAERQEQEAEKEELVIETPEPVEEEREEEDILGELAASYFSEMSIENKVAGLFMVTPEAITGVKTATQAGEGTQEALNQYAVGGLIYFSQNIVDKEQIMKMLSNTSTMSNYPIFLAVDEEGGDVSRIANSSVEVEKVEAMSEIGASGDAAKAREAGETIGSYLKELGFNVDFAPVADVAGGEDNALGNRSFGSDPELVKEMAVNVAGGIEDAGVSACLKHFPGLGSTTEDTHEGRVEITKSLEELKASDFVPFQAGVEAGVDFVMVSHATAPALDDNNVPSSLSRKVITDTLRGELGYQGVVITDALNMTAITDYYTPEEAAVMALEAGADMLLMPEDFEKAYEAVLAAVQEGKITEERIDESLERIYRVKCAGKLE
ncbi:MAG: hypothetical protein NC302_02775 [Bacteroidales bacterium]|nr:hypothetical protein [Bacteroidales bacterium]MCM1414626.1 beta-N-acetylhexosaminidase [bacterium]MCM1423891.1 beta-N-acetylhexosaminidase [bacterium]